MRKLLSLILFFILILLVEICSAQKVEFTAGVSGNLYNYTGTLSSSQTNYYSNPAASYEYRPPYGTKLTAGYGADIKLKWIDKGGFIFGIGSGYDVARNKSNLALTMIDNGFYSPALGITANYYTEYGYAVTTTKQINANPYLGYRLKRKSYSIDLELGAEVAFFLENKQRKVYSGNYPSDYTYYYSNAAAVNNSVDYRLKGGIGLNYRRFIVDVNYARSIANLYKNGTLSSNTSNNTLYAQLIKLGVGYRL